MADYKLDISGGNWWCNTHHRRAEFICSGVPNVPDKHVCDPRLGGILLPCEAVPADAPPRDEWDLPAIPMPVSGRVVDMGFLPEAEPDELSPMQKAVLDGSGRKMEGQEFAYQTNQGTVYLASPADIARQGRMDQWAERRFSRMRKLSNREVDTIMGEADDGPPSLRRR